jgi:hypothetical protein
MLGAIGNPGAVWDAIKEDFNSPGGKGRAGFDLATILFPIGKASKLTEVAEVADVAKLAAESEQIAARAAKTEQLIKWAGAFSEDAAKLGKVAEVVAGEEWAAALETAATRTKIAQQIHFLELGLDTGGKPAFNLIEAQEGAQLEAQIGKSLRRYATDAFEWVDKNGKTYDAVGSFASGSVSQAGIFCPGASSGQENRFS